MLSNVLKAAVLLSGLFIWYICQLQLGCHPVAVVQYTFTHKQYTERRSQWPRGLRRRSTAARLLRLWVRIPPGARMFVCCECCLSSGRGLCDGLITRPEESYRLWRVVVCDQETSQTRRLKARYRAVKIQPHWVVTPGNKQNNNA